MHEFYIFYCIPNGFFFLITKILNFEKSFEYKIINIIIIFIDINILTCNLIPVAMLLRRLDSNNFTV